MQMQSQLYTTKKLVAKGPASELKFQAKLVMHGDHKFKR